MGDNERKGLSVDWPAEAHDVLARKDIRHVAYVPDGSISKLITLCEADRAFRTIKLTSEEEGVGVLAGSWLGGVRGALLMQSSGVGSCINALSMAQECRFPLLMVISMRGEWGEFNPWQVHMGQAVRKCVEAVGAVVLEAWTADAVAETIEAGSELCFNTDRIVAVLMTQRAIGAKKAG